MGRKDEAETQPNQPCALNGREFPDMKNTADLALWVGGEENKAMSAGFFCARNGRGTCRHEKDNPGIFRVRLGEGNQREETMQWRLYNTAEALLDSPCLPYPCCLCS